MQDYLSEEITCFSLLITFLSYSVHPVRQTENVLTYNLAKSTLYLHRGTLHSLQDSINLSYLWTLQMSNKVNAVGFN